MPFTAGTYTAPSSPGAFNPAVDGQPATPAAWNALLTDLSTALSTAVLKDGTQTVTANIPMNSKKFTDLVAGSAATDSVTLGQVQASAFAYGTDASAGANTIVVTASPAAGGLTNGLRIGWFNTFANTGACTLNVSSLSAIALVWPDGTALSAGDVPASAYIEAVLSASSWRLVTVKTRPITTLRGEIAGLTYANNGADATNDIDIAAGECTDGTSGIQMTCAALTKRSDASWQVGSGNGALDTGVVGDSDYYIWAIMRVDTHVTDYLFSLSSTTPTMPANYTLKRLIGWFKRVAGAIVAFNTYEMAGGGLYFLWSSPTLDVNLANTLTTSRRTDAVKVPLNLSTAAILNVAIVDASAAAIVRINCPDQADVAPGAAGTAAPLGTINVPSGGTAYQQIEVKTSATGTIAARATLATVDQYGVSTEGFKWSRRP